MLLLMPLTIVAKSFPKTPAIAARHQLRLSALRGRALLTSSYDSMLAFLQRFLCFKDRTSERCAKSQRACDDKQAQETE